MNSSRIAVYPGSFDPLTNGHVNLVRRGLSLFDGVIVTMARNIRKTPLFSIDERVEMVREVFAGEPSVQIDTFDGLLVNYCQERGARVVMRGLRAVSDFEFEFQMASMNHSLAPEVETLFMMTEEGNFFLSSNLVKEVAILGGDVSPYVPASVHARLVEKLGHR